MIAAATAVTATSVLLIAEAAALLGLGRVSTLMPETLDRLKFNRKVSVGSAGYPLIRFVA
ncbi:hypothetical protein GCM10028784_15810 [Myceligenerans cantabricum]